jgi:hypothetical protein
MAGVYFVPISATLSSCSLWVGRRYYDWGREVGESLYRKDGKRKGENVQEKGTKE